MGSSGYLMEHAGEARRLELKTDRDRLVAQASWAGIRPGMRVADIGCGSGKTSAFLYELVQPGGEVVGLDGAPDRVAHARERYGRPGLSFVCRDVYNPLDDLGSFDFIWSRFFLEYHRSRAPQIIAALTERLKPGGIMALVDLDYNCLSHFGLPQRLVGAIDEIMRTLEESADFDPYVGRKLYTYLYDLGLKDLDVAVFAHHLIFGPLGEIDAANWKAKVEVAVRNSGYAFADYPGGYAEFFAEFESAFADPRRFTYTPLIACRGCRP